MPGADPGICAKTCSMRAGGPPINVVPVSMAANEAEPEGNEMLEPCIVNAGRTK